MHFLTPVLRSNGRQWAQKQARDTFVRRSRSEGYVARSAYKLMEMDDKYGLLQPPSGEGEHLFGSRQQRSAATRTSRGLRRVLDLGCSPGSWCQVIRERCGEDCLIFAVDLLPVKAQVPNTTFIQGDMTSPDVQQKLFSHLSSTGSTSSHAFSRTGDSSRSDAGERMYSAGDSGKDPCPVFISAHTQRTKRNHGDHETDHSSFPFLDVVTSDVCVNRMGGSADRQRQCTLQLEALSLAISLLRPGGHFVCKALGSRSSYTELWAAMERRFRRVSVMKPLSSRSTSDEEFVIGRGLLEVPRPMSSVAATEIPGMSGGGRRSFGLDDWPGMLRCNKGRVRGKRGTTVNQDGPSTR